MLSTLHTQVLSSLTNHVQVLGYNKRYVEKTIIDTKASIKAAVDPKSNSYLRFIDTAKEEINEDRSIFKGDIGDLDSKHPSVKARAVELANEDYVKQEERRLEELESELTFINEELGNVPESNTDDKEQKTPTNQDEDGDLGDLGDMDDISISSAKVFN